MPSPTTTQSVATPIFCERQPREQTKRDLFHSTLAPCTTHRHVLRRLFPDCRPQQHNADGAPRAREKTATNLAPTDAEVNWNSLGLGPRLNWRRHARTCRRYGFLRVAGRLINNWLLYRWRTRRKDAVGSPDLKMWCLTLIGIDLKPARRHSRFRPH